MSTSRPEARERVERVRSVFLDALAADPQARGRFLDGSCGGDQELRLEVEQLLEVGADAPEFLQDLARRARAPLVTFAPEPSPAGRRLGPYRLIRELGRGGMGAVYLAERADDRYERLVAFKLLPLGLGSPQSRERFRAERRVLASLDHPGIARLLDAGATEDATPYFIMEYVEGEPITHYCDRVDADVDDRLKLFLQVCDAVEYAHRHKVVHRDLKPANILVTPDGSVKLLDFGIAKVLDDDMSGASSLTQLGGSPLTPSYASPEQVAGEAVGFTSDVYQLGVLLYHLLTGSAPYCLQDLAPAEVRRVILELVPPPPSEAVGTAEKVEDDSGLEGRRARLRGDLDSVVLKALLKEPGRRYGTVSAFAADVARHMEGRQVLARRERTSDRVFGVHLRSRRVLAAMATAAILALAAAGHLSMGASSSPDSNATLSTVGGPGLPGPLSVSTRSVVAFRFYQEGVSAYYRGATSLAYSLFSAATREDTTFAMAWYYLGHSTPTASNRYGYMDRARRLAREHSTEREQLLINAVWAEWTTDPSLRELAESLVDRYPDEVDGHFLLGVSQVRAGEFLAAMPFFEHVVMMDSAHLGQSDGPCRGCDALNRIVDAYVSADSLPAAERTARRWVRLRPESATAWHELAWTLWRQDRGDEALAARLEATQRRATTAADQIYPAVVALRLGEYSEADRFLAERIRTGTRDVRQQALWWQALSFRSQGRLREALASAADHRALMGPEPDQPAHWLRVELQAQVLFEMGQLEESAALMDSAAAVPFGGLSAPRDARHRLWVLTHASTVAMAAGDTARVRMLADTIEALGKIGDLARDRALHRYVRGMLSAHIGDRDAAVAAFRDATASNQFARGDLELARLLIDTGQAEEATEVLHRALRGPLMSHGFYVTRPEFHELLGRAWDVAGRPDSAAVHYRRAIAAWQHADPEFAGRREEAERRLAALPR